jgi:hypothetical protein
MTAEIPEVAERLAEEFSDVPPMVVMETVCICAEDCDHASPLFVEQAARASLREAGGVPTSTPNHGPPVPDPWRPAPPVEFDGSPGLTEPTKPRARRRV